MKILLGVTGSVAAIKTFELHAALARVGEVKIAATEAALRFFDRNLVPGGVYTEREEWDWKTLGDPVLHIDLRSWFDVLVIAPLTANTLAKMAQGLCDNLLTSIWLAASKKTTIIAPAMNTGMWEHPMTQRNLRLLRETFGGRLTVVPPVEKLLACGDVGMGAMAEIDDIVKVVRGVCNPSRVEHTG